MRKMPFPGNPKLYTNPTGSYTAGGIAARQGWIPGNVSQAMNQGNQQGPKPPQQGPGPKGNPNGPKPNPNNPGNVRNWLAGDVDYMNAVNDLKANLGAYKTQNITNRGDLRQDYLDTKLRLGQSQDEAGKTMAEDFAARGMFGAGTYLQDQNKQDLAFQQQGADAESSYGRNLSTLVNDLRSAQRLKMQKVEDARLAAIRRRAEKYGIRS